MRILSWNIQYGLGVDGRIDLGRIARVAQAMGAADVMCFQELASGFPEVDKGAGADQPAQLAALFPGLEPVFRPALDRPGAAGAPRRRFGNMVLSRWPVLGVDAHVLPRPPDASVMHMVRQALAVVVAAPCGPMRIVTTHLEFHSARHRAAQIDRLRDLQMEWAGAARQPPRPGAGTYAPDPPAVGTVFCGDFNFPPEDPAYAQIQAPFHDGTPALRDAWRMVAPDRPHAPTCGIYDAAQWPQGPHARDFFFVSADLAGRIESVATDTSTDASDHQPILLALRD
jgi:endonuclease/exonuclease/phosphatase family metal-dependent hydrolase